MENEAIETVETTKRSRRIVAETPEEHENRMIALAMSEVEDRIRKHTATSQELTHFLKLATAKEQLEKEKLKREIDLLEAKKENLESQKRYEELIGNALESMKIYMGSTVEEEYGYVED